METERLIIDSLRETDKEAYFQNISHDRKVLETFICKYADCLEEFDFSGYLTNPALFAIRLKKSEELIGILVLCDETDVSCEIGYGIGSQYWHRGYATEAVRRFIRFCFEEKGLRTVYASFFTGNDASRRVMEKCGMTYCRFSEKELTYLGVVRDLTYYAISDPANIGRNPKEEAEAVKYPWINEYLMAKRGVTKDLQPEWNWIRYQIGGKMFAAVLLDDCNQPYYINLKLEPMEGELMRQQYPDIIPDYYSNKQHWNSVKPDGMIPDDLLKHWLDRSYELVLKGFPKQKQRDILGLSVCGTDCSACPLRGSVCTGCNDACGKVFHANGKACPIYACCAGKYRFTNCAVCSRVPCEIWQATRDPSMTDEQFRKSIEDRMLNLRGAMAGCL